MFEESILDFSDTDNGTHHLGTDSAYLFAELTDIIDSTPHVEDCTTMKRPDRKRRKNKITVPPWAGCNLKILYSRKSERIFMKNNTKNIFGYGRTK